jgi:hypothetical protein
MALVQLSELRTRALNLADLANSAFVGTPELNAWVNAAAGELYDLLVSKFADYFTKSIALTTVAGQEQYALPDEFYKLVGVDLVIGGRSGTLDPFPFHERNRYRNASLSGGYQTKPRYWLRGSQGSGGAFLHLLPVPAAGLSGTIWYVPKRTPLVLETDTLDGMNDYEDLVVFEVAARLAAKEEGDPSPWLMKKAEVKQRIEIAAQERDEGSAARITDVTIGDGWEL